MIIDQVAKLSAYAALHPLLPLVLDFVERVDITGLPTGRHELSGASLFVTVARLAGRSVAEAPLEVHNGHWDIHWLLAGQEQIGWSPRSGCLNPRGPFDETKDMQLFDDAVTSWFRLSPGQFALFMPQDAHAPLVGDGEIHKLVFKLAVDKAPP